MFPFIPLFALVAILGGGATLAWYWELTPEQRQEADRVAAGYAQRLFGKALKDLTKSQVSHVENLTKKHFEKNKQRFNWQ